MSSLLISFCIPKLKLKPLLQDGSGMSSYGDLMADFEVAVLKQRQSCMSGSGLPELKEYRF